MRVVLDTNVLVRANPRAAGVARALLAEFAKSSQHILITSPFLMEEVARVLAYPRLQALWPLTPGDIQAYVEALGELSEMVYPGPARSIISSDPDDDPVIEAAVLGRAEYLCTLDRHFYSHEVLAFLTAHSVQLLDDARLLDLLRRTKAGE